MSIMVNEQPILINNKWITTRESIKVVNPYNGDVIARVCKASPDEAQEALCAAQAAFAVSRRLPAYQKSDMLRKTAFLIQERQEALAQTIAYEAGKPLKTARAEVARAAVTFHLAAEEASRIMGEVLPLDISPDAGNRIAVTCRFALGPVMAITPFNFPLNLVAHKIAPAIAAGNTVIHKPSSATPLTALKLGEILLAAGMPAGMVNIVPCSGEIAGGMISDERIKMISFTGSPEVGWQLKKNSAKKKITLELGGNAAVIIEPDADLDKAVERCLVGGYVNAGQVCISVQRIYVHEKIYENFTARFVEKVKHLKTGDPLNEETDVGPLISEQDITRVHEWIMEAKYLGGTILTGGYYEGTIYQPTVLANVPKHARCVSQELFAPATVLFSYRDFEQAIQEVNDSVYGLQAGVFTSDVTKIMRAFNELEVGGVMINEVPTFRVDNFPYGGVKDSGYGREGVKYAIEEMTEIKVMVLHNG